MASHQDKGLGKRWTRSEGVV